MQECFQRLLVALALKGGFASQAVKQDCCKGPDVAREARWAAMLIVHQLRAAARTHTMFMMSTHNKTLESAMANCNQHHVSLDIAKGSLYASATFAVSNGSAGHTTWQHTQLR